MLSNEFFDKLKELAKKYSEIGGSHEFSHIERVYNLAIKISEKENVDLEVVKAAALLHDVARQKEDNGECECHAQEGAKMAKRILEEINFPKEKIESVCYAVQVHRHSTNIAPETREAAILQDADRLDALGAITIARMFSSGGKKNIPLYDPKNPNEKTTIRGFHNKILKITPETFKTEKAKKIAKERYKFVQEFLERFINEWDGKE